MARRIVGRVCLHLDEHASDTVYQQRCPDELARDLVDVPREERPGQGDCQKSCSVSVGRASPRAPARSPAEILEVDAPFLRSRGEPLGEIERLVEHGGALARVHSHVVQDRPLGPRGDQRLGDPLDPDPRPPAAALVAEERLQRVDLVGAGVLAEAEKDHSVRHCA